MNRRNPNLAATEAVARRLGPLLPGFVFVGGCATGLLITDPGSAPVRVTRDVDVIAEVASYGEYSTLGERLRSLGFREDDAEGAPVCRWAADDLRLDVMPATGGPLGFTNRWYVDAIRESREYELAADLRIRLVSGPLFLATKFEAFLARGHGDYYMSQDLEDMISVIDGRVELAAELEATIPEIRAYLATRFSTLVEDDDFLAALPGQFPGDEASQERVHMLLTRLRGIATG